MNLSCSLVALLTSLLGLGGFLVASHYYKHIQKDDLFIEGPMMHHGHGGHGRSEPHSMEGMKKRCDEGFKMIKCHRQCGEDMACHDSCPLPECPKMAARVKGIIRCNAKCGSDFACRNSCNVPVTKFLEMCSKFEKPAAEPSNGDFHHGGDFHHRGDFHHQGDFHHGSDFKHHGDHHHHHRGDHHNHSDFHHGGFHHGGDHGDFHNHGDFHHGGDHGDFHHHGDFHRHGDFHHGGDHGDFHHHGDLHHQMGSHNPEQVSNRESVAPMLRGSQPKQSTEEFITCAMKCHDKDCSDKCSAAWMELRKDCSEMVHIMGCHKKCHHDSQCHRHCPRPHLPWLNQKVEASHRCHQQCGDRECHHKCKCPFAEMKQKCASLGPEMGTWKVTEEVTM